MSFSWLFHDIWLVLNVKGLCVIVDSLISTRKVYVCVIFIRICRIENNLYV